MRLAWIALAALLLWGCKPSPPATTLDNVPNKPETATAQIPIKTRSVAGPYPDRAEHYRADLIRNARLFWGMSAPIATMAAQVHQESGWRPDARSPYAAGLTQFTPATAEWIGSLEPGLASRDVYSPAWALRALAYYDRWLWDRIDAHQDCDRFAMTLAAYNGGLGWIQREKAEAARRNAKPDRWYHELEEVCLRAAWACKENRGYPRRIMLTLTPRYEAWGPAVECPGID